MRRDLESVSASIRVQHLIGLDSQIPEWVNRDQHMDDVGVDLPMFESLLEVVVDCFIGDFAQQREI